MRHALERFWLSGGVILQIGQMADVYQSPGQGLLLCEKPLPETVAQDSGHGEAPASIAARIQPTSGDCELNREFPSQVDEINQGEAGVRQAVNLV